MDNTLCDGSESELMYCRFDGWGHNDCEFSEAAGVICNNKNNSISQAAKIVALKQNRKKVKIHPKRRMEIRLSGGRIHTEGRVEVK